MDSWYDRTNGLCCNTDAEPYTGTDAKPHRLTDALSDRRTDIQSNAITNTVSDSSLPAGRVSRQRRHV